jgi:hypothetical protein
MKSDDVQPGFEDQLRRWLPPLVTLISTILPFFVGLPILGKFIVISVVLWALGFYVRFGRRRPTLEGSKIGAYVYSERLRSIAFIGLISIPSIVLGVLGSQIASRSTREVPITETSLPAPFTIDTMDEISTWVPSFCDNACGGLQGSSALFIDSVPGKRNGAIEILYNVKKYGWVLITKQIDPIRDIQVLSRTKGISFFYKSNGALNTIELKLLLHYPGDPTDTAFGAFWKTDTKDTWTRVEALYNKDIKCWWPEDLCKVHGDIPELTAVKRIDLAISNRSGDTPGLGKIAFDELIGIPP